MNKDGAKVTLTVDPEWLAKVERDVREIALTAFFRTLADTGVAVTSVSLTVKAPAAFPKEATFTIRVAPEPSRDQPVRSCSEPRSSAE